MINSGKNIKASFGLIPSIWGWAPNYSKYGDYFTYTSVAYDLFFEKSSVVFDRVIRDVMIYLDDEMRDVRRRVQKETE